MDRRVERDTENTGLAGIPLGISDGSSAHVRERSQSRREAERRPGTGWDTRAQPSLSLESRKGQI
jgi:hypothetical protein